MPNPFFDILDRNIALHVSEEASLFVHAVFSLNDPRELRALLTDAGFEAAEARPHSKRVQPPAARDFLWQYIHCTPLMSLVTQADARGAALERAVVAGWQPYATGDGMSFEQTVLVSSGRNRPIRTSKPT
jgi:hypothetical protein